jgi:hypothetical protein
MTHIDFLTDSHGLAIKRTERGAIAPTIMASLFITLMTLFLAVPSGTAASGYLPLVYDGYYLGWTPSVSGALHFSMVDDGECNKIDWNSTDVQGKADSYGVDLSSIPDGSIIDHILIRSCVATLYKEVSGSSEFRVYFRLNGMLNTFYGIPFASVNLGPGGWTNTSLLDWDVIYGYSFVKDANTKLEAVLVYGRGTLGIKVSAVKVALW